MTSKKFVDRFDTTRKWLYGIYVGAGIDECFCNRGVVDGVEGCLTGTPDQEVEDRSVRSIVRRKEPAAA